MMPTTARLSQQQRGILLHDGLSFLVLSVISVLLYAMTWFLFRSFEAHRVDLGVRWAERGKASMAAHKPDDAIASLRTALSYTPDDRADQLLLAQALAAGGHTEEATNYFMNLWEQTPGDGLINLELARLARRKHDVQPATNYYRAAIFGNWEGDGPARRRDVRIELADYLTEQHELTAARSELFIAAANNPTDATLALAVADRLAATGDLTDALAYQDKAIALDPNDRTALIRAGQTAYALGEFVPARHAFERALQTPSTIMPWPAAGPLSRDQVERMAQHTRRAIELSLSRDLPQPERAAHLAAASTIAEARLNACIAQVTPPAPRAAAPASAAPLDLPPALAQLKALWTVALTPQSRKLLVQNADVQDQRVQLIDQTEQQTRQLCGAPAGDDAILLMLASMTGRQTAQAAQAAHGR